MKIDKHNIQFLLFIEPELKAENPIIDVYTRKITGSLRTAISGGSGYTSGTPHFCEKVATKGFHSCSCGATSNNQDYLIATKDKTNIYVFNDIESFFNGNIKNTVSKQAVITNSLAIHYVACHRKEIDIDVLDKILLLKGDEIEPTEKELS